jgi:uncharacterized protein (TIGR02611 family)
MSGADVREEPRSRSAAEPSVGSASGVGDGAGGGESPAKPKLGRISHMAERLEERRENHLRRSRPHRVLIATIGFLLTILGVVMTGPVPGPGFLIIPLGLALLALEFQWAEHLLQRALAWAESASENAARQSTGRKVAAGVAAALAIAAFVTAAILWDIPVLPV